MLQHRRRRRRRRTRTRHVCHIYLDYALTYSFVSTIPMLFWILYPIFHIHINISDNDDDDDGNDTTNAPEQQQYRHHHQQVMSIPSIVTAMLGGVLLSMGNLSFQWATAVYKAPLTTILALQASMTVILGTCLNYVLEPSKTPHPVYLAMGVMVFLIAIGLATTTQLVYAQERQHQYQQQQQSSSGLSHSKYNNHHHHHHRLPNEVTHPSDVVEHTTIELQYGTNQLMRKESDAFTVVDPDDEDDNNNNNNNNHTNIYFVSSTVAHKTMTGLWIAFLGGLCFGFFSPCFNVAVNDPFGWSSDNNINTTNDDASLLVFYSNLWFSLSFGMASVVGNLVLLKYYDEVSAQQTTIKIIEMYLTQASWTDRRVAVLAGFVCAMGNVLQFHGGQLVGYATADLVQAYPLVSTFWDILWFGEFASVIWCCSRLSILLIAMYLAYLGGIILLAISSVDF